MSFSHYSACKRMWFIMGPETFKGIILQRPLLDRLLHHEVWWCWILKKCNNMRTTSSCQRSRSRKGRRTFTLSSVVPWCFATTLDVICNVSTSLMIKLLDIVLVLLRCTVVCTARFPEDLRFYYAPYCKYFIFSELYYTMPCNISKFDVVMIRQVS